MDDALLIKTCLTLGIQCSLIKRSELAQKYNSLLPAGPLYSVHDKFRKNAKKTVEEIEEYFAGTNAPELLIAGRCVVGRAAYLHKKSQINIAKFMRSFSKQFYTFGDKGGDDLKRLCQAWSAIAIAKHCKYPKVEQVESHFYKCLGKFEKKYSKSRSWFAHTRQWRRSLLSLNWGEHVKKRELKSHTTTSDDIGITQYYYAKGKTDYYMSAWGLHNGGIDRTIQPVFLFTPLKEFVLYAYKYYGGK